MAKGFIKTVAAAIAVIGTVATLTLPVFAADTTDTGTGTVTGNVSVTGSISPLIISETHAVTSGFSIDPNTDAFTDPPITITNNTKCPINVIVQSLSSSTGGSIQFQNVLPTAKDWSTLSLADSKKYIALGALISDNSGWNPGYNTVTDWAAGATPTSFGSLNSGASGKISFTADFGSAFDSVYTAAHTIVFEFDLV
jgi:hypothetical protein